MAVNVDTNAYIERITAEYSLLLQQKILLEIAVEHVQRQNEELKLKLAQYEAEKSAKVPRK